MKICKNLDPRTVIFANMAVTLVGLFIRDVIILLIAFACTAVFAMLLGVNPGRVMFKLRRFLIIIVAAALLQSVFTRAGTVILEINGLIILTSGGINGGALILLRMSILLLCGAAIASCGIRRNIQALIQLKLPYEIAFMACVGIHFIPLMMQEMQDSVIAVQLRGIDLKNIPMRKRVKVYTYIFLPAVGSAIMKAQNLAESMELRGFRAYPNRTSLIILRMRVLDYFITALFVSGAAAVMIFYSL
jgi:energy-coupling factor transport system permease protein